MTISFESAIFWCGFGQLLVLVASAMVPMELDWTKTLASLPKLMRQMFWVYGGYVVLSILALGLISVFNAAEIALSGGLARAYCLYVAVFWGVRLCLQAVFDARPFLTKWWLRAGYHLLSLMFLVFTAVYGYGAFREPVSGLGTQFP